MLGNLWDATDKGFRSLACPSVWIQKSGGSCNIQARKKGPTLFKAEEDNLLSSDGPDVTTLAIRGLTARGLLQPLTDDVMTWAEASCNLSLMM